jgi:hypothetical protein
MADGSTVNFNICLSTLLLAMCLPSSLFIFVLPLFQFIVHFTLFLSQDFLTLTEFIEKCINIYDIKLGSLNSFDNAFI